MTYNVSSGTLNPTIPYHHQMAPPRTVVITSSCSLLVLYRPRKDERLSWPSWLTYSRRFTHIKWSPVSCIGRAQDSESSPVKDQRSAAEPRNGVVAVNPIKPHSNGPLYSNTVIGTLAVDGYSEEGPRRAAALPSSLLAVSNVTARPSTASVPTSYYSICHYRQTSVPRYLSQHVTACSSTRSLRSSSAPLLHFQSIFQSFNLLLNKMRQTHINY